MLSRNVAPCAGPPHRNLVARALPLLLTLLILLFPGEAGAHPGFLTSATVHIEPDHTFTIFVQHDALAFAVNEPSQSVADEPMLALLNAPRDELSGALDEGHERFARLFILTVDGAIVPTEITHWPTVQEVEDWKARNNPPRLPVKLEFVARAHLPESASKFSMKFPAVLGDLVVSVFRPGREPESVPVLTGESTPVFELTPLLPHASPKSTQATLSATESPQSGQTATPQATGSSATFFGTVGRYIFLGFEHIVPKGLDHILFVLGLFCLSPKLKPLFWQVTAFTIAHSVTLALAALHIIRLPPSIVEPLIAASITFVAVENLCTNRIHAWRPLIVFCFGLVHGMGFAGVLEELGLPQNQLVPALISFNIGVECGQLTVIAGALLLVGWFRNKPWYRKAITIPISILIALIGAFWTYQRIFS